MFALALGIDYALFIVAASAVRRWGSKLEPARRGHRDDGHGGEGGALLGPDLLLSLLGGDARADPVPLDGVGIILSVVFVLGRDVRRSCRAVLADSAPNVD